MSLVGSALRKYQVVEQLGQGGMAVVYKGYHPDLQRTVALKVLKHELAADDEFVKRFHREAQTAAQLKHVNIVTIYDVDQEGGTHYIVMEFLPGRTLQQEIGQRGAPRLEKSVEIIRALADALDYAHQHKLVHRDVKPSNVMIAPDGRVTLMDFGIVKAAAGLNLTGEGVRIGTPEYMSPEQASGRQVDYRSDIYSLGVVLYELLVGRVPFQATSSHKVLQSHVQLDPTPPSQLVPDLPRGVEKVILRAMAKRPSKRFGSAGQLAAALEQAALPKPAGELARSGESRLKLLANDGRAYPLAGIVGLGRASDNQVQIPDTLISRYHAQIRSQGARCQIVDLGSRNRTFINNQPLAPNHPYTLRPGDQVRLGPKFVSVVAVDTTSERPGPAGARAFPLSGLWRRLRANPRSCALALLGGGIVLVLLVIAAAALQLTGRTEDGRQQASDGPASSSPGTATGNLAELVVINDTDYSLELEIGDRPWSLRAGQRRTIHFPAGEYDYTVTLESGAVTHSRGAWQPGLNPDLYLAARE